MTAPASVVFLAESSGEVSDAQILYRALNPAWGLSYLGLRSGVFFDITPDAAGRLCGLDEARGVITEAPDVLVCRRPDRDVSSLFTDARLHGQQVWIDLDDDVWHMRTTPKAPAFNDDDRAVLEKNLAAATGALCSTPALAEVVRSRVLGLPAVVCPPSILTPKLEPKPQWPKVRLGWMGSTNWRAPDLAHIADELTAAVAGLEDRAEFVHIGWTADAPPVTDFLPAGFGLPVLTLPWVPVGLLTRMLRANVDVLVLPQEPGPFNEARSITSGLAAAAAGVPFAYSETGPFLEAFGPSPDLGALLRSRKLRRERRAWAYRVAAQHHPRRIARHYLDAFDR